MNLSPPKRDALETASRGHLVRWEHRHPFAYGDSDTGHRARAQTVESLVHAGLLVIGDLSGNRRDVRITPAGVTALRQARLGLTETRLAALEQVAAGEVRYGYAPHGHWRVGGSLAQRATPAALEWLRERRLIEIVPAEIGRPGPVPVRLTAAGREALGVPVVTA